MYALFVPTLAVAGYGFYRRIKPWFVGKPLDRLDRPSQRIVRLLKLGLLQQKTIRERFAGLFHQMIFWGFIVLFIATTVVLIDYDFQIPIMHGEFYLYFQSFFVDVLGLLFLIGIALAGTRRWIFRPRALVYSMEASLILAFLFVIGATGFLVEGWRIAATADPCAWSPVGYTIAKISQIQFSHDTLLILHRSFWWLHMGATFIFLAWAPYTKMAHVLLSPANIYLGNLDPIGGSLKQVDFESSEVFGVNSLAQFTWKDLADLDACTECGRCTASCPANDSGKPLSPRDIILDLQKRSRTGDPQAPLIGTTLALSSESLWSCTTCAACVEACPVSIEQLPKIVDLRRHLVMDQAEFPEMMQDALSSLENRGHPFRGTQSTRLDWAADLDVPEWQTGQTYDILYWVGCAGALVERNQKPSAHCPTPESGGRPLRHPRAGREMHRRPCATHRQ